MFEEQFKVNNSVGCIKGSEWMCNEVCEGTRRQQELNVIVKTNSGILELETKQKRFTNYQELQ